MTSTTYRGSAYGLLLTLVLFAIPQLVVAADDSGRVESERQITQPGNNAPMWREVRSGKAQTTQVRGVETGVLVQSRGETWRELRPLIALIGATLMVPVLAVILVFYRWRGPIELEGKLTGRLIERFDVIDRVTHWIIGISFVVLAITGLTLSFGKYILIPVIGHTLFSLLATVSKNVHNFVGPVFLLGVPFFIVRYGRDNLPKLCDFNWFMKFGGMLSKEHVPSGRFNAGEKSLFWFLVCFLCVVMCGSGLVLDFPNFGQGRSTMQTANIIHWVTGLMAIMASLIHIYLGTIGVKHAYAAMRYGYVDETWAKEHHEYWYKEVVEGKSKQHFI